MFCGSSFLSRFLLQFCMLFSCMDCNERPINDHKTESHNFEKCMLRRPPVVSWSEFLARQRMCIVFPVRYELNLYKLCRRK
jgi:hypothetical protein